MPPDGVPPMVKVTNFALRAFYPNFTKSSQKRDLRDPARSLAHSGNSVEILLPSPEQGSADQEDQLESLLPGTSARHVPPGWGEVASSVSRTACPRPHLGGTAKPWGPILASRLGSVRAFGVPSRFPDAILERVNAAAPKGTKCSFGNCISLFIVRAGGLLRAFCA